MLGEYVAWRHAMDNRQTELRAAAERVIDAPAPLVYQVIADYQNHHPHILPDVFSNLEVEQGGHGAGTVISFDLRAGGKTQHYHGHVEEPIPGHTLREVYDQYDMRTTFEVTPVDDASQVRIETVWVPAGRLRGWIEARFAPRMLSRVFSEELDRLNTYAQQQLRESNQSLAATTTR
jgi:hypothetical protein